MPTQPFVRRDVPNGLIEHDLLLTHDKMESAVSVTYSLLHTGNFLDHSLQQTHLAFAYAPDSMSDDSSSLEHSKKDTAPARMTRDVRDLSPKLPAAHATSELRSMLTPTALQHPSLATMIKDTILKDYTRAPVATNVNSVPSGLHMSDGAASGASLRNGDESVESGGNGLSAQLTPPSSYAAPQLGLEDLVSQLTTEESTMYANLLDSVTDVVVHDFLREEMEAGHHPQEPSTLQLDALQNTWEDLFKNPWEYMLHYPDSCPKCGCKIALSRMAPHIVGSCRSGTDRSRRKRAVSPRRQTRSGVPYAYVDSPSTSSSVPSTQRSEKVTRMETASPAKSGLGGVKRAASPEISAHPGHKHPAHSRPDGARAP